MGWYESLSPLTGSIDVPLWNIGNAASLDTLVPEPCYRDAREHRRKYQGQTPHADDDNGEDGDLSHLGRKYSIVLQEDAELGDSESRIVEDNAEIESLRVCLANRKSKKARAALSSDPRTKK